MWGFQLTSGAPFPYAKKNRAKSLAKPTGGPPRRIARNREPCRGRPSGIRLGDQRFAEVANFGERHDERELTRLTITVTTRNLSVLAMRDSARRQSDMGRRWSKELARPRVEQSAPFCARSNTVRQAQSRVLRRGAFSSHTGLLRLGPSQHAV